MYKSLLNPLKSMNIVFKTFCSIVLFSRFRPDLPSFYMQLMTVFFNLINLISVHFSCIRNIKLYFFGNFINLKFLIIILPQFYFLAKKSICVLDLHNYVIIKVLFFFTIMLVFTFFIMLMIMIIRVPVTVSVSIVMIMQSSFNF